MKTARFAILAAMLASSAMAGDLKDRIKAAGTPAQTAAGYEYTVRFTSPPAGMTGAYATYTEAANGPEYVTYTTLRRLPNGQHQLIAIIDQHADATADVVLTSTGMTLREAFSRLRNADAAAPNKQAVSAYERCVRSLLAPRNLVMAAR